MTSPQPRFESFGSSLSIVVQLLLVPALYCWNAVFSSNADMCSYDPDAVWQSDSMWPWESYFAYDYVYLASAPDTNHEWFCRGSSFTVMYGLHSTEQPQIPQIFGFDMGASARLWIRTASILSIPKVL
jgi:hypothetical protein